MAQILTTHGTLDEADLSRIVGFEDRPLEFAIWVEWRLSAHNSGVCAICDNPDMPKPVGDSVLVRRDAHVFLKEPSVVADAIAASL